MNFIRKMTQKNARNSSDCSTSNNSENDILFQTSTIHRPIVALQRADECSRLNKRMDICEKASKQAENNSPENVDNIDAIMRISSSHSSQSSYGPDPLTIIHPDDTVAHVADGTPQVQRLPKRTSNRKMPGEHVRRKTPRRQNALNEIKYLQNSVDLLIPRLPFQRLVREIFQEHKQNGFRTQAAALAALHEAAEMFLVELFSDSMVLAARCGKQTLGKKDYRMAQYILQKFDKI